MKWKIIALTILAISAVIIYRFWTNSKSKSKIQETSTKIQVQDEKLILSGQIAAENIAVMRFRTVGKMYWIGVSEQEMVKKGQVLARLDPADFDKVVSDAWYNYLAADANAKKIEDDVKDHNNDESFVQKNNRVAAQTARDKYYDAWLAARRDLQDSTLRSPINGIVTKISSPQPGVNLTATTQAEFVIVNPESLYFSAAVDQTEVGKIHEGLTGNLVLDTYPDATISGQIKNISFSPKEDETGTVYEVKFAFPLGLSQYRLGMTGDLTFDQ